MFTREVKLSLKFDNVKPIEDSELKKLIKCSLLIERCRKLIEQVDDNDFTDSEGHELKKCAAYIRVREMIDV